MVGRKISCFLFWRRGRERAWACPWQMMETEAVDELNTMGMITAYGDDYDCTREIILLEWMQSPPSSHTISWNSNVSTSFAWLAAWSEIRATKGKHRCLQKPMLLSSNSDSHVCSFLRFRRQPSGEKRREAGFRRRDEAGFHNT